MDHAELKLPLWQSHKRVHAAEIESVDGTSILLRISKGHVCQVQAAEQMFARYTPVPGDYYVVYDQGTAREYASIAPKRAFEEGYERLYGASH